MEMLQNIKEQKVIAIIRGIDAKDVLKVADELLAGGIQMMEITFDQRNAKGRENTLQCMEYLHTQRDGEILLGAGTVLNTEQVKLAWDCGAKYIISPDTNEAVIRKTKELGMISMPGALTPTEIVKAYNTGADIVKIFPAGVWGEAYIKAVCAPLTHIPVCVVGGIGVGNIRQFLQEGACCAGIGNNLVSADKVQRGEFSQIREYAKKLMASLKY